MRVYTQDGIALKRVKRDIPTAGQRTFGIVQHEHAGKGTLIGLKREHFFLCFVVRIAVDQYNLDQTVRIILRLEAIKQRVKRRCGVQRDNDKGNQTFFHFRPSITHSFSPVPPAPCGTSSRCPQRSRTPGYISDSSAFSQAGSLPHIPGQRRPRR